MKEPKAKKIDPKAMVLLRRIRSAKKKPSKREFNKMLERSLEHAKKHKIAEKDMWNAIRKARKKSFAQIVSKNCHLHKKS